MGDGLRVQLQLSQAVIVLHQSTVPVQVVCRTVLGRDKEVKNITCIPANYPSFACLSLNLGSNQARFTLSKQIFLILDQISLVSDTREVIRTWIHKY